MVDKMNKKSLVLIVVLALATSMFSTSLAQASSYEDKPNEKFQNYAVTGTYTILTSIIAYDHTYVPSSDQCNKLILTGNEVFSKMQITVGEKTYELNKDFAYSGEIKTTIFAQFNSPMLGFDTHTVAETACSQLTIPDFTHLTANNGALMEL
jgi:hypothetical protein